MRPPYRALSLLAVVCSSLFAAANVSWISGQTGPAGWTIDPINPSTSQTISFTGPTDVYSNSCFGQMALGGQPAIVVDHTNKVVELTVTGTPPSVCVLLWMPVCGLQGQFGRLPAGRWVFRSSIPAVSFEIPFTVGPKRIIYVDKDSPSTSPDGSGWSRAYRQLQDALAVAWSGDQIRVAEGTYRPSITDRSASFVIPAGVEVLGGYAGYGQPTPNTRHARRYKTILSGDLYADDLWGILNRNDNSYHVVYCRGCFPPAILDGFTITAGQADGPYPDQYGGGVYVNGGSIWLRDCTINNNSGLFGGGIACIAADVRLGNCIITANRGILLGGGVYMQSSDLGLVNCLLAGNSAYSAPSVGGSAIFQILGSLDIQTCTIADNVAPSGKAITGYILTEDGGPVVNINNSILYNGGNEIAFNENSWVSVKYSDVKGGFAGPGNIDSDPMFVENGQFGIEGQWIDGDYHLGSSSPCINRADSTLLGLDTMDLDNDGNTSETVPVDLDGVNRVRAGQLDMGAYEAPGSGPGSGWIAVATIDVLYDVPEDPPSLPIEILLGPYTNEVTLNFRAQLMLYAASGSAADGTWTAWFDPDPNPVGPGTVDVTYYVRGAGVELWRLPAGQRNVRIATVTFYVRLVP